MFALVNRFQPVAPGPPTARAYRQPAAPPHPHYYAAHPPDRRLGGGGLCTLAEVIYIPARDVRYVHGILGASQAEPTPRVPRL